MSDQKVGVVVLEAKGLTKRFTEGRLDVTVLKGVDLQIRAGETLAIVGASGSGKSTLLGLLAGLDLPTSGKVKLLGHDLFGLDEDGRAFVRGSHVGFVFQSFQLLPHLTALENVMLPLELQGEVSAAEMRRRATVLLERVGLGARLSHYPKTLSGGEQQRVALARAFVTEPDILFADEPTGSLDTATGEAVIALMFELNQSAKSTLVLVTHDRSVAARCNRILTIEAGHLVGDETVTEL